MRAAKHYCLAVALVACVWGLMGTPSSRAQDGCCRAHACPVSECGRPHRIRWANRARFERGCGCSVCCGQTTTSIPVLSQAPSLANESAPKPTYTPLFNGVDLNGWHGLRGIDLRELSAMSEEDRQKILLEDDADMRKHWRVENGEIVNDGEGVYLATDANFRDYELWIDYKTVAGADSGIYLKGTPQVQIWDTTEAGGKWNIGADKGSGGLWNNTPGNGKDPLVLADKPFGEWNRVRVQQIGGRTSVWLNDQQVVDWAILENYWDKSANPLPARIRPIVASGPIQLQTHGGEIRWRNILVREIPIDEANRMLAAHDAAEFQSIFNGQNFDGWAGPVENFEVIDGTIRCKPHNGGTIYTSEEYGDFAVRFEFQLPPAGNNGLAIRYPGQGDAAYDAMCELQVLDSEHANYATLDPRQYHGSAYGMVAAHRGYLRDAGEWNFQEVVVRGSKITVELNGNIILETDLAGVTEFMGGSPHPGKDRTSGHFGFAGHNDPVAFRNISIRRLD